MLSSLAFVYSRGLTQADVSAAITFLVKRKQRVLSTFRRFSDATIAVSPRRADDVLRA